MVQPVAVAALLHIAATGNDVQRDAPSAELVQRGGMAGGQSGGHEPGAVSNQESQGVGARGRVAGNGKAVGSGRGIADEHLVESTALMGLGELGDIIRVHAGGNLVGRVDAAPEQADGNAAGGVPLPVHSDHSDNFDAGH